MRRYRWTFLIVLGVAAVLAIPCSRPVTGKWSEPVDGIQAALRVAETRVRSGDEIPVSVVFRNTSNAPREIPSNLYQTLSLKHNGRVYAEPIGDVENLMNLPPLQPGEERVCPLTSIRTSLERRGEYSLEGRIGAFELARIACAAE